MTRQKHLKERVRARMSDTGERYAVARSHVAGTNGDDRPGTRGYRASDLRPTAGGRHVHASGIHPETSALRILLANAGIRTAQTDEPPSEGLVLAIGGGIGMGMFQFRYPEFSSFYVAGRHLWHDGKAFLEAAVGRLGLETRVTETSGRIAAERNLFAALEHGPVIAWVDLAELGYLGLPGRWSGGGYHVLVVYEVSASTRIALVGDQANEPIEISLAALATSRSRIEKQRNRLLGLAESGRGPTDALDIEPAVRAGLRACVDGLRSPRNRSFSLDALTAWADRMVGERGAERWSLAFPRGRRLWTALRSIAEWIDYSSAGPGLLRPLYADGLREVAALLDDRNLADVADRYEALGRSWSELAMAALPDDDARLRETRQGLERLRARFREAGAGATAELAAGHAQLDAIEASMDEDFPLAEAAVADLLGDLRDRVRALHREETEALAALAAAASKA